jgi:hypothetical protein
VIRRHYYGWFENGEFRLSHYPADSPTRPSVKIKTVEDVLALLTRRGVSIDWWPPLPDDIRAQIEGE